MTPYEIELRKKWIDWYHTLGRVDRSDQAIADFWLAERKREKEELVKWVENHRRSDTYEGEESRVFQTTINEVITHLKEI